MTAAIRSTGGTVRFGVAGDSSAWPDPTAHAIHQQLLRQAAARDLAFFASLGDAAGPGVGHGAADPLLGTWPGV